MPAYRRHGDSDTPELVPDDPPEPARKGRRGSKGKPMKAEPSTADPSGYCAFSDPTAAMAASAIIGPAGSHDVHGQPGLGTAVSN